ncbi:DUF4271 domain-containing protein [Capnocytophaga sp.]|uniref:DUF4271 domain-containing protein n=1 Tax=Capnocytophaga sp. TaxID=44737 RepID=UPI0026DBEF1B|nr:DUF4271 domain-containing protein [Capnocytophaga sp.]MDO5105428.1 DUF4271 domain-containing protein [Capnocytophaga sp.]
MESIALNNASLPWIFPAFLGIFAVVALLRVAYPNHFWEYLKLPFDNKYIVIYEKKERKVQPFTVVSLFLQWISLGLFFYVWAQFLQIKTLVSHFLFLDIIIGILLFFMIKLAIQKWISSLFELKNFAKPYIFTRIAYSSYAALLMIMLLFFVMYATELKEIYFYILLLIFLVINLLSWVTIIKMNQNAIKRYIIYFILYLCTLEIAPYIFLTYGHRFL